MKLDLNQNVSGLDGKEIENSNIGKTIAMHLASSTKGNPLKLWDWALKLHNEKPLDLDPSDIIILKDFISNSESFTILFKAQALEIIENSSKLKPVK